MTQTQSIIDEFYKQHGACCAGCDWWRWHNSVAGECIRTAPVAGSERFTMLRMKGLSITPDSGHIVTLRDHICGEFKDADNMTANE